MGESEVVIDDKFTLTQNSEITERFVALIEPRVENGCVVIDDTTLVCDIEPKITVKALEYHNQPGTYNAYCIDYVLPKGKTNFKLQIKTK
jgi:hypothetical protein